MQYVIKSHDEELAERAYVFTVGRELLYTKREA